MLIFEKFANSGWIMKCALTDLWLCMNNSLPDSLILFSPRLPWNIVFCLTPFAYPTLQFAVESDQSRSPAPNVRPSSAQCPEAAVCCVNKQTVYTIGEFKRIRRRLWLSLLRGFANSAQFSLVPCLSAEATNYPHAGCETYACDFPVIIESCLPLGTFVSNL